MRCRREAPIGAGRSSRQSVRHSACVKASPVSRSQETPAWPLASLKDLYFDELGDLYDAETQMIRTLPRLAEAARAPELREALKKHCDESRLHLERLELIFTHWGERRRVETVRRARRDCSRSRRTSESRSDRRRAGCGDHRRRAAHRALRNRRLWLRPHLRAPAQPSRRSAAVAGNARRGGPHRSPAVGNRRSAHQRRCATRGGPAGRRRRSAACTTCRWMSSRRAGPTTGRSPIRNTADEELGVLDGLVAEGELGAARYAVVDAGGLLTHRRYLLPLSLLRFDERDASCCASSIDKDVAEPLSAVRSRRVPDDERRRPARLRSGGLLKFFPRETGDRAAAPDRPAALPEWLLTGTWITVLAGARPGSAERGAQLRQRVRAGAGAHAESPRDHMVAHEFEPPPPPPESNREAAMTRVGSCVSRRLGEFNLPTHQFTNSANCVMAARAPRRLRPRRGGRFRPRRSCSPAT